MKGKQAFQTWSIKLEQHVKQVDPKYSPIRRCLFLAGVVHEA